MNSPRAVPQKKKKKKKKITEYLERTGWNLGTATTRRSGTPVVNYDSSFEKCVDASHCALTSSHVVQRFGSRRKAAAALHDISTVARKEVM